MAMTMERTRRGGWRRCRSTTPRPHRCQSCPAWHACVVRGASAALADLRSTRHHGAAVMHSSGCGKQHIAFSVKVKAACMAGLDASLRMRGVACQESAVAPCIPSCMLLGMRGRAACMAALQDLAAWHVSTPLEARRISERCHPCYMNAFLRGDTARMPQRGLYAPQGARKGALLGVYDAMLKTVREDAAYVNADPTCMRGMAASYTFDVPWSKTADNDGLVLVGEANGGLMGLINDTKWWWVYGPTPKA